MAMTQKINAPKFIDLTHTLTPEVPFWTGECGFESKIQHDYADNTSKTKFRVQKFMMRAGIGTHMDAPLHCVPDGIGIADLSLEQLINPGVVIDVSQKANETYRVSVEDIQQFETMHGKIAKNTIVLVYTGWERFWTKPDSFINNWMFPSVSVEAAKLLLERDISGLGIDTLSADRPSDDFPVHQLLLGAGKFLIENVAHASLLPAIGATVFALPIKVKDGTEAPIRLLGMVN